MRNFEQIPLEKAAEAEKQLTGNEKFEVVLKLFGTATARDAFIETCKKYAALRSVALPDEHGENSVEIRGRSYSPPQRANLHNQIMDALKRLSLQKMTPLQQKIMNEMASREMAGKIIKEWSLAHEDREDEEDELMRKRNDMSGPAYFHSLGKEH